MKTITAFLMIASVSLATAQDTSYFYFDKSWKETDKNKAVFYRKVFPGPENLFVVHDFYLNGQMQMKGMYHDKEIEREEGHFIYYHSNGTIKSESDYHNDTLLGSYKSFYENGNPEIVAEYKADGYTGVYKSYYENGKLEINSLMKNGMQNGYSEFYHPNGTLSSSGVFTDGMRDGEWKYYDENGKYDVSEYHYLTYTSTCGFVIKFDNDRWININHEEAGRKEGNLTLTAFLRRDSYNKNHKEVPFKLDIGCFDDVTNPELTSKNIAQTVIENKKVKAKQVTSHNDTAINLRGGVLYAYEEKVDGIKSNGYLYVKRKENVVIELFFTYDKSMEEKYIKEIFDIINKTE